MLWGSRNEGESGRAVFFDAPAGLEEAGGKEGAEVETAAGAVDTNRDDPVCT